MASWVPSPSWSKAMSAYPPGPPPGASPAPRALPGQGLAGHDGSTGRTSMAMVWRPDKIQGVDGIDRKAYRKGGEIEGTDVEGGTDHSVDGTGVEISRKAYLKALTLKEAQRKEKLKAHPLKYKAYRLKYSQSEKGKAIIKKWEKSDNGKASRKKTDKKRGQSDKRKAYRLKYRQSEKGKAIIKKWQKSDNGKAMRKKTDKKYVQSAGGKVAQKAAQKKYAQSAKAKAARKLWEKSDKRKAWRKKYQQSTEVKAAQKLARQNSQAKQKWKAQKWESAETPVKVEGVALDKDTLPKRWAYCVLDRKYNSNAQ